MLFNVFCKSLWSLSCEEIWVSLVHWIDLVLALVPDSLEIGIKFIVFLHDVAASLESHKILFDLFERRFAFHTLHTEAIVAMVSWASSSSLERLLRCPVLDCLTDFHGRLFVEHLLLFTDCLELFERLLLISDF